MKFILALPFTLLPWSASAACHIKAERAIVCPSGRDAVLAYREFGFDASKMGQSYNQAILHQSGCFLIGKKVEMRQMNHGRVAFTDGWAGVTTISAGPGLGEIADQYLEGKCDRYRPESFTLHPSYATPDYGR